MSHDDDEDYEDTFCGLFGGDGSDDGLEEAADDGDASDPAGPAPPLLFLPMKAADEVRMTVMPGERGVICGGGAEAVVWESAYPQHHPDGYSGTGGRVWECAPTLCTILAASPDADFQNRLVVELGAGTGAVGLWVAKRWQSCCVILTDVEEALPLLRHNVASNGLQDRCYVVALPFGKSIPEMLGAMLAHQAPVAASGKGGESINKIQQQTPPPTPPPPPPPPPVPTRVQEMLLERLV
jgi:hypothetical protein